MKIPRIPSPLEKVKSIHIRMIELIALKKTTGPIMSWNLLSGLSSLSIPTLWVKNIFKETFQKDMKLKMAPIVEMTPEMKRLS
jgi:hypothetical protein